MRFGNLDGRAVIVTDDGAIDVATASGGLFDPDPQQAYGRWDELREWASGTTGVGVSFAQSDLGPPVPRPGQVLAVGFNYLDHVAEADSELPRDPQVFTKFSSCLAGPESTVALTSDYVDWEVELVVVIGREARDVAVDQAWSHVAGLTVGQDISDRRLQMRKPAPQQFSLGKSCPGFGPTGPLVVTPDELSDPDDLELSCSLDGEQMQSSRTSEMLFSVSELISRLSAILPLGPGDLLFTGTPSGIGATRDPRRFIRPGETLATSIEGLGSMTTRFVAK